MKRSLPHIVFLLSVWPFLTAAAQSDLPVVTGTYHNMPFEQFVDKLQQQYGITVYHAPAWTDSLLVSGSYKNTPLETVLLDICNANSIEYFVLPPDRVVITGDYRVRTTLPKDFFERRAPGPEEYDVVLFDFEKEEEHKLKSQNAAENMVYEIGAKRELIREGFSVLAGHIKDAATGEAVVGAVVFIEEPWVGTATDMYGFYSITLPTGKHSLQIQSVGMKDTERNVVVYADGKLDIELHEEVIPLKEVIIEAEKDVNVAGLQMGYDRLDMKDLKQIPSSFGETDIMKVALNLPGVQTVGESASGFNVRGGATDQNLVLINQAPVYNTSHLFGFFSVFNPDVIKGAELYKSGIPARYGGRASSVFEVNMKEGNKKRFGGSGGLGIVTTRLALEGPIVQDKASFVVGGRTTYSNWILKQIPDAAIQNSSASFYDINAKVDYNLNDKNAMFFSAYYSRDNFKLNADSLYRYHNLNATAQWKHIYSNKLNSVLTGAYSQYAYNLGSELNPVNAFDLSYSIRHSILRMDFNWFPRQNHNITFGVQGNHYHVEPGSYLPAGDSSLVVPEIMQTEYGLESAVYVSDQIDFGRTLSLELGLRYSMYQLFGPKTVYSYAPGFPRLPSTTTGSTRYAAGETIATYHGPEYRMTARYILGPQSSLKLSYNRLRQYIHMLSNTTAISPTDTWKLSDNYVKPQIGDQLSLGLYRNMRNNTIEGSVEAYYKRVRNYPDYRAGADLLLNTQIETDILPAFNKAYGVELLLRKKTGKLNGWVSYTYSRSLLRIIGRFPGEQVNLGSFFPANYDKPHDFTLISNYRFTRRFSASANVLYSTGRPITYPTSKYQFGNSMRIHYSERNAYRIPDYFRVDLSLNLEGNHKIKKLAHSSWTLSVYNLTGRDNVYSIYFVSEGGNARGYQLSVFSQAIPTLTYNFRF
jgi:hypothetical protein